MDKIIFYVEIGTINGYNRYKVYANSKENAAERALNLHHEKGRYIRGNDVIKVYDYRDGRTKTFYPKNDI